MIKHIRIDERLVHGQVASFWSNSLRATRIMVVNNHANGDEFTKQMLRMATPTTMKLSVLTTEKAVDRIKNNQYEADVVLMVIKCVKDAYELYMAGYEMEAINIGNISKKDENPNEIYKGIYLNAEDQEYIDKLKEKGVKVTVQQTPQDGIIIL